MAELTFIRENKEKHLLLLGINEEGESARYTLTEKDYAAIGSPRGEIDGETLALIKRANLCYLAKKKALSLLSYSDNGKKRLYEKLVERGFPRDISQDVTDEMVSLGYINEERQLERLILNEANVKLRGPVKITLTLKAKGYSGEKIKEVMLSLMKSSEIDFKANAKKLLEKKLPSATSEERKAFLYKNGYKV